MLPSLSLLDPKRRRSRNDATVHIIDAELPSFVVCLDEERGAKFLLQRFFFAESDVLSSLNNVPNFDFWQTANSFDFRLDISMENENARTCTVNGSHEFRLKRVDDDAYELEPTFFFVDTFKMVKQSDKTWTVSIHLHQLGCVLSRFLLVVGDRTYVANVSDTVFPVLSYAQRETTEVVPTARNWHMDRPADRKGPLLNVVRSMSESGSSTEVLRPNKEGLAEDIVRCEPFHKNRTVVFNGSWLHRAPEYGGAREFLMVDMHDKPSNFLLVTRFLAWISADNEAAKSARRK
jgi:hypothetical protein